MTLRVGGDFKGNESLILIMEQKSISYRTYISTISMVISSSPEP